MGTPKETRPCMFQCSSPTFSKLKCPRLSSCPFGADQCIFSHDPAVYLKGGLDGRIGLSSMTYYKDLQKRIRSEEAACKESKLFEANRNAEESKVKDGLSKAIEGDLITFLHTAPAGCKISASLREKVLLKLVKAMRQVDASSSLSQAATVEKELLVRSGCRVSSVYLSSVSEYIKKNEANSSSIPKGEVKQVSYEDLREIVADSESLAEFTYPQLAMLGQVPTILVECSEDSQICRRCGLSFAPAKYYKMETKGSCRYHSGKIEKIGGLRVYGCCHAPVGDSNGCETGDWHVFEGFKKGDAAPKFFPLPANENGKRTVVALDAEMFYTVGGYEVSRVTLVDFFTETTLLDILLLPRCPPVLDYNTKWSGVSAATYESAEFPVYEFEEGKRRLAEFIDKETILVGHSLDNDLRVLEFHHSLIVDTAILYPHRARPPYRMSLKSLALGHLSELIQQSLSGHDSKEDCLTCVRLVKKYFTSGKREIERVNRILE